MASTLTTALTHSKSFKLALIQMLVTPSKSTNLQKARSKVLEAARNGANVVVLPECFNSPYGTGHFPTYAEPLSDGSEGSSGTSPTTRALSEMAKEAGIHLFDINIPNKIRFQESETLSPGNSLTHIPTEYGLIGIGICYDMRFPELAMIAARKGCVAMIYPGAFNTTTGPLHWELLQRARAVDNQMYVAACSPARDPDPSPGSYLAWGHSTIVDPMGAVVATTEEKEDIVYAEVDVEKVKVAREGIPVSRQRRFDVYKDVSEGV
ncbi:hypothetical protein HK102_002887 [Quaeritorhiza haematococci]|nr:hypothetical protein HK102_002887 [Quaeritorhiza haematococci]